MTDTTIEVYTFFLHKERNKQTKFQFKNVNGTDISSDFHLNLIQFIDDLDINKNEEHRVIHIPAGDNLYKNYIGKDKRTNSTYGILKSGIYGKTSEIVDVDSNTVIFTAKKNHALVRPFYFHICFSPKKDKGILFLERHGVEGISGLFKFLLQSFVSQRYPEVMIKFEKFVDDAVIRDYITNGDYSKISVTRNSLPTIVAQRYGLDMFDSKDFKIELNIIAKRNNIFSSESSAKKKIISYLDNHPDGFFTTEDFKNIGFDEQSDVKVKSTLGGNTRTINLNDHLKIRPYYEIKVNLNKEGYSDFNSIKSEVLLFLNDMNLKLDLYD